MWTIKPHAHTHTHKKPLQIQVVSYLKHSEGQTCPFSITALCVFVSRWLFPCCSPGAVYLAGSMLWGPGSRTLLDRGCRSLVRFSNDCCPGCHAGKSPEWHNIKVLWDFLFLSIFICSSPSQNYWLPDCDNIPADSAPCKSDLKEEVQRYLKWERERETICQFVQQAREISLAALLLGVNLLPPYFSCLSLFLETSRTESLLPFHFPDLSWCIDPSLCLIF